MITRARWTPVFPRKVGVLRRLLFLAWAVGAVSVAGLPLSSQEDPGDGEVRPFDLVRLKNGGELTGTIQGVESVNELAHAVAAGVLDGSLVEIQTGGGRFRLPRDQIESILPRRTPAQAYAVRLKRIRTVDDARSRAQVELELGRWCAGALEILDGQPPLPARAVPHFLNAAELDPGLRDVYPELLARLGDLGEEPIYTPEQLELETRVWQLAQRGGVESSGLDLRMARVWIHGLRETEPARPLLERALGDSTLEPALRQSARRLLARVYEQDVRASRAEDAQEGRAAVQLYRDLLVEPETAPENFEPYVEMAKLSLRSPEPADVKTARSLLLRALAIRPGAAHLHGYLAAASYVEGDLASAEKHLKLLVEAIPDDVDGRFDLALVRLRQGRWKDAEALLEDLSAPAESGRRVGAPLAARVALAKARIHDARGDVSTGLELRRKAVELQPEGFESKVDLAFALARGEDASALRESAEALLTHGSEEVLVFAAASRLLADLDVREGRPEAALRHLLRVVGMEVTDPLLLERTGILLLRAGRLDAGAGFLERSLSNGRIGSIEAATGLAYFHHVRSDAETARRHFRGVLERARRQERKDLIAYANRAVGQLDDQASLEVVAMDFAGPDASTLPGWLEEERFGIEISRSGGRALLKGEQASDPGGVTVARLERTIDFRRFEQVSLSGRVAAGAARLGLRLEGAASRGASVGIVLYRDLDGFVRVQVKSSRGGWESLPSGDAAAPEAGGGTYDDTVLWPRDREMHELRIRRSQGGDARDRKRRDRVDRFDLFFDDQSVATGVVVPGLGGPRVEVGFSGQATELGARYTLEVDEFKIYRNRLSRSGSSRKGREAR